MPKFWVVVEEREQFGVEVEADDAYTAAVLANTKVKDRESGAYPIACLGVVARFADSIMAK